MRTPFLLLLVCFPGLILAQFCTPDNRFTEADYFSPSMVNTVSNVAYGEAVNWQNGLDTLLMDVHFPAPGVDPLPARPLIVMIHGGGFQSGSKAQWTGGCEAFARRGFVAATINYRLGWNTSDPIDQLRAVYRAHQDAHAAMRFLVSEAATYGIDTNWIFIGGSSAGAITALNVTYSDQSEWNATFPGIQSLLGGLFTSTNSLTNTFDIKGIFNNWGGLLNSSLDQNEMVPMASFHGTLDQTIAIDTGINGFLGSGALHNALINAGICSELSEKLDGEHGIYRGTSGTVFRVSRASCFFKSVFCNNCSDFYTTDSIPAECSLLTALEVPVSAPSYQAYPNPFQHSFQIEHLQGGEDFYLSSPDGRLIYQGKAIDAVNWQELPAGIYFLRIATPTRQHALRLVKQ